jgi:uncharacterized protein DUF6220
VAALRTVYRYWAWLVFAAVVLQVGFAGYGAFYAANKVDDGPIDEDKFNDGFGLHLGVGYLIVLLGLVLLILALAGRVRGRMLGLTGLLFGLLILQVLLAWFSYGVPVIGFFHPVNALAIFALSGYLASTEWRMVPVPATAPAP